MAKFWATRIDVSELRAELRVMRELGDDDAQDALDHLRGKRGRLNFVDSAWHARPNVQRAIQDAGTSILTTDG